MDISKLNKLELGDLLKSLKLYRDLNNKLWSRGRALFNRNLSGANKLVVEYFPSIDEATAFANAKSVYKKVFSLDVAQADITFVEKNSLQGWIKVYKDDSMVDMSFSKIEGQLRK